MFEVGCQREKLFSGRLLRCTAVAILLAGAAIPIQASGGAGAASDSRVGSAEGNAASQTTPDQSQREIVVTGQALFPNIQPERQLDQTGIESYGLSTIDELVGEIENELGDTDEDQPMVIVNGQPINDLSEIGALPVEALRNLQVLPRGSAVRLGGTSGQRVISLTLRRTVHSATLTAARKVATDGDWNATRGEAILTDIHGSTRANLTLRVNDQDSLLESQRGIIEPQPVVPYAIGGNVIAYPDLSGEIDSELTAAAGKIVTVAAVPQTPNPTLADFAANANNPAITNNGQFRTLRPQTDNYDLNGNFSTKIAPWLTGTATVHLSQAFSRSLRGLPSALFVLPSGNPFSPFSTTVGIAVYGRDPLRYRSRTDSGDANLTLNGNFGSWHANFNARHSESKNVSTSDRQTAFGSNQLGSDINPFAGGLSDLIAIGTGRTSARSNSSQMQLQVTGPLVDLPAGPLLTTVEGRLAWNHLRSVSTFSVFGNRDVRRSEQSLRVGVEIPLTSRAKGILPQVGEISATGEYESDHFSDTGTLVHYAYGLTWEPLPALRLNGSIEQNEVPPFIQFLGGPILETPNVFVFDPLTGQNAQVVEITGGNPSLKPETDRIRRLSGILQLVPKLNLQLNAEYTDTDRRNFVSSLPDESAAIMLAFPDRFVRDSNGALTTVDLRPVNFESDQEKRLRWGFSMNTRIGGAVPGAKRGPGAITPTTYLQLSADDTIVFSDRIVIRSGLDPVDLLGGGAIGIGGGRGRHQVDGTAAITSGGLGTRIGLSWRSRSTLLTQINSTTDLLTFSPVMIINLRAFADGRRILPGSKWAKGLRLSVDVLNVANDRQKVRDSLGNTPLQYQPGYRDPIGRTIEIEVRKVF